MSSSFNPSRIAVASDGPEASSDPSEIAVSDDLGANAQDAKLFALYEAYNEILEETVQLRRQIIAAGMEPCV